MSDHKFKVGQLVNYTPLGGGQRDVYQIMQLVPPVDDEPQYRIKSETEPHQRIVKESQLKAHNRV